MRSLSKLPRRTKGTMGWKSFLNEHFFLLFMHLCFHENFMKYLWYNNGYSWNKFLLKLMHNFGENNLGIFLKQEVFGTVKNSAINNYYKKLLISTLRKNILSLCSPRNPVHRGGIYQFSIRSIHYSGVTTIKSWVLKPVYNV